MAYKIEIEKRFGEIIIILNWSILTLLQALLCKKCLPENRFPKFHTNQGESTKTLFQDMYYKCSLHAFKS